MKYHLSNSFICATTEMAEITKPVSAPYLRRSFSLPENPEEAVLTVSALGFYELWVNGVRLTKGLLSPYITNPDDVLDYDFYDIAPYLQTGENVLAFQLGNGMQNAMCGYVWDFDKASFRSSPLLSVFCGMTFSDGRTDSFEADERFCCAPSPVLWDDLRGGEVYDARQEIDGWNLPGFDDSSWTPAVKATAPKGEKTLCRGKPIQIEQILGAKSVRNDVLTFPDREECVCGYLYDFGVNTAGVPILRIKGERGQRVEMIFGEYINDDGHFDVSNIRFDFLRKEFRQLPPGLQKDVYICRGGEEEVYMPRFTYHGARYALVSGITSHQAQPSLLSFAVAHSDLGRRGGFSCSDETMNRLQEMTERSILANFFHFPTDCPHREKNGWTADAALSAEACFLNFDPADNYREWLLHIRKAARGNGSLPGIIPTTGWGFDWGNGPAWDQVLVTLTDLCYRFTGDPSVIAENAGALLNYCRYLAARRDENGLLALGLGDWCAPHGNPKAPLLFTDSVISRDIAKKTAFLLRVIRQDEGVAVCETLADSLYEAIRAHLIDQKTMTAAGCCQTSQAMALFYGIFTPEETPAAYEKLLQMIHEADDHIDCGVLGARVLFRVLTEHGDADLALRILTQKTAPSYGEWVARGETALCEDFAPYSEHVNSLNHHFFGDISAWFIEYFGGIRVNDEKTDSHRVDIVPVFPALLSSVSAGFKGTKVRWFRQNGGILLILQKDRDSYGTLRLPQGYAFADGRTVRPVADGAYWIVKK